MLFLQRKVRGSGWKVPRKEHHQRARKRDSARRREVLNTLGPGQDDPSGSSKHSLSGSGSLSLDPGSREDSVEGSCLLS